MDFKTRLKELRESRGLTQRELADQLNNRFNFDKIYAQTISYWENGREPNLGMLLRLAQFFDVPTDYLLGNTDKLNMSEVLFDEKFDTLLNKNKLDSFIENLPDNLKTSFYDMFNDYITALNLSDSLNDEKHILNYNLDYMYIVTRISKLILDFENKIIPCFFKFDDNYNGELLNELDYERCNKLNSISLDTINEFTNLLNKFTDFFIFSLQHCNPNDNADLFFKKEILNLSNEKEL
ncbi:plasmid maintenance system antidote protein [Clostridium baratii]|uniref:helix-turn-helix domain-containing protein n=1 Tax=Clostridium baratii TaxID=1561 RepID=UPI0006C66BEB|nr:helix-turn-helix transcriptional regulator [Clostridium baratii]CUP24910.1 plasmid maintenance system antidote protein [Clostridium baratii]